MSSEHDDVPPNEREGERPPEGSSSVPVKKDYFLKADAMSEADAALKAASKPQPTRQEEFSPALAEAYAKAGTLKLADDEAVKLLAPFPDEVVEIKPDSGMCYIPHIHISDRLTQVLGPGQWTMIRRWERIENGVMYAEHVLIIRGAFIGEAVGAMNYSPTNARMNYSDCLEGTQGEALRRICGKRLGVGSQVWNPEYCKRWIGLWAEDYYEQSYKTGKREKRWRKRAEPSVKIPESSKFKHNENKFEAKSEPPAAASKPSATQTVTLPPVETKTSPERVPGKTVTKVTPDETPEQKRDRWVRLLRPSEPVATAYFREIGILLPDETIEDYPVHRMPATKNEAAAYMESIRLRMDIAQVEGEGNTEIEVPREAPPEDADAKADPKNEWWRSAPIPFGKNKGTKLREIDKDTLYGWWANYKPQPWTSPDGKRTKPVTEADLKFRRALDAAGEHYGFTLRDK